MKVIYAAAAAATLAALPLSAVAGEHAAAPDYAAQVAELGGDATAGQRVYNQCRACHVIDAEQNRVGPHQVGIIGRPAGIVDGYAYSPALMAAAEDNPNTDDAGDGLVWDIETLSAYLANPRQYIRGTKMAYAGLRQEQQIADVITYLFEAGGVYEAPAE